MSIFFMTLIVIVMGQYSSEIKIFSRISVCYFGQCVTLAIPLLLASEDIKQIETTENYVHTER